MRMGAMAFEGGADRQRQLVQASQERQAFQRQLYRKWNTGDVYGPHDLSSVEQKKWKLARKTPASDAFDTLGINPIAEYKVGAAGGQPRPRS
jgi:small subunit ribosomal protein S18